jgi:translation elongation factor EF-4
MVAVRSRAVGSTRSTRRVGIVSGAIKDIAHARVATPSPTTTTVPTAAASRRSCRWSSRALPVDAADYQDLKDALGKCAQRRRSHLRAGDVAALGSASACFLGLLMEIIQEQLS